MNIPVQIVFAGWIFVTQVSWQLRSLVARASSPCFGRAVDNLAVSH